MTPCGLTYHKLLLPFQHSLNENVKPGIYFRHPALPYRMNSADKLLQIPHRCTAYQYPVLLLHRLRTHCCPMPHSPEFLLHLHLLMASAQWNPAVPQPRYLQSLLSLHSSIVLQFHPAALYYTLILHVLHNLQLSVLPAPLIQSAALRIRLIITQPTAHMPLFLSFCLS